MRSENFDQKESDNLIRSHAEKIAASKLKMAEDVRPSGYWANCPDDGSDLVDGSGNSTLDLGSRMAQCVSCKKWFRLR